MLTGNCIRIWFDGYIRVKGRCIRYFWSSRWEVKSGARVCPVECQIVHKSSICPSGVRERVGKGQGKVQGVWPKNGPNYFWDKKLCWLGQGPRRGLRWCQGPRYLEYICPSGQRGCSTPVIFFQGATVAEHISIIKYGLRQKITNNYGLRNTIMFAIKLFQVKI